ncbi:putative periplasmic or secreted lipoprotein [Sulfuricella denitrificans skB26]|uniref:Putative periplasmic or secreted lipoprotein n=2 Tax=Sulfuricella denitrificans TaxID=649841 RepID=S6AAW6_SULDS|nr:putative periplasmic or secreted lipoprotein [Sulfuricella denitrificans skB26]
MPNHKNTPKVNHCPLSCERERVGERGTSRSMASYLYLIVTTFSIINLQGCFPVVATGAGTAVLMAEDRRTSGIYIEDQGIELKASNRLDEKFKDTIHVNVTSYNRTVLITGEVPSEATKQEAETTVRGVPNVRNVLNELAIAGVSSYTSRSNDSYLTSKVKVRFVDLGKFQANHIKVVTENNVVYLLGIVKRNEADSAVEIARTTGGVQKVVKLFEYID